MTTELHEITIIDIHGARILDTHIDWVHSWQILKESSTEQDLMSTFKKLHALRPEDILLDTIRKRFSSFSKTMTGKSMMTFQDFAMKLQRLVDINTVFIEWSANGTCDPRLLSQTLIIFGFDGIVNPKIGLSPMATWKNTLPTCPTWRLEIIFPITHPRSFLVGKNHNSSDDTSMLYRMVLLRVGLDNLPSERNIDHFWFPEERPHDVCMVPYNCPTSITSSDLYRDSDSILLSRPEQELRCLFSRLSNIPTDILIEPSFHQRTKAAENFLPNPISPGNGNQERTNDQGDNEASIDCRSQETRSDKHILIPTKRPTEMERIDSDQKDRRTLVATASDPNKQFLRSGHDSNKLLGPPKAKSPRKKRVQARIAKLEWHLCNCGAKLRGTAKHKVDRHLLSSTHRKWTNSEQPRAGKKYLCECGKQIYLRGDAVLRRHLQSISHREWLNPEATYEAFRDAKTYLCECGTSLYAKGQDVIDRHLQTNQHKNWLNPKAEEKYICECGLILEKFNLSSINRHCQSMLHKQWLNPEATKKRNNMCAGVVQAYLRKGL